MPVITYPVTILQAAIKSFKYADAVEDLRAPPAIPMEALKGDCAGQWSVLVNDQFRICFRWTGTDAENVENVENVDYH